MSGRYAVCSWAATQHAINPACEGPPLKGSDMLQAERLRQIRSDADELTRAGVETA